MLGVRFDETPRSAQASRGDETPKADEEGVDAAAPEPEQTQTLGVTEMFGLRTTEAM